MAALSAKSLNSSVDRVADKMVRQIFELVDAVMKDGYAPFTVVPDTDTRLAAYLARPDEEWRRMAQLERDEAVDQISDFANLAGRRGAPELAERQAGLVRAEMRLAGGR